MSDMPPSGEPAIRTIAMPADTNPSGDIFGGWLISQMDLAGGSAAGRRAGGPTVTVKHTNKNGEPKIVKQCTLPLTLCRRSHHHGALRDGLR